MFGDCFLVLSTCLRFCANKRRTSDRNLRVSLTSPHHLVASLPRGNTCLLPMVYGPVVCCLHRRRYRMPSRHSRTRRHGSRNSLARPPPPPPSPRRYWNCNTSNTRNNYEVHHTWPWHTARDVWNADVARCCD